MLRVVCIARHNSATVALHIARPAASLLSPSREPPAREPSPSECVVRSATIRVRVMGQGCGARPGDAEGFVGKVTVQGLEKRLGNGGLW